MNVWRNGATLTGKIYTTNKSPLTEAGFYYSTTTASLTMGLKVSTTINLDTGYYNLTVDKLVPNTTYYYQAFAKNREGTALGDVFSFRTESGTLSNLSTGEVEKISRTSADIIGSILNDGGYVPREVGVCYSNTSSSPMITHSVVKGEILDQKFSMKMINMIAGTRYYARVYAISAAGTSYGQVVSFITEKAILATGVVTGVVNGIALTSAGHRGSVGADEGSPVTARGICYSNTNSIPSLVNSTSTNMGIGTGSFVGQISNLLPGTLYYTRAFASNAAGTSYGEVVSFKTLAPNLPGGVMLNNASSITQKTAFLSASVSDTGGGSITAKGFCYSKTTTTPTRENSTVVLAGLGTGNFNTSLSNLELNTNYYVRAYATNQAGTTYSSAISFRTSLPGLPTDLSTYSASGLTISTAEVSGYVGGAGGGMISSKGICYSATTSSPMLSNSSIADAGSGTGSISISLKQLEQGKTYYYRVFATNEAGTAYGTTYSFTTRLPAVPSSVSTFSVSSITANSAYLNGAVGNDGGAVNLKRGFVYSTSTSSPALGNSLSIESGTRTGSFGSTIYGLSRNTKYYVRTYATNSAGTSYGTTVSFTTSSF